MVLAEQVRQLQNESSLIDDDTTYNMGGGGWGTLKDYGNIVLTALTLIVWRAEFPTQGRYRIKIGSYYVWGRYVNSSAECGYRMGLAYVAAGTHGVVVESKGGDVRYFKLGKAKFSDEVGENLATYASQISKTVASRTTCVGPLKNSAFIVVCWAKTTGAQTNFENPGDSLTNGVSLAVDGTQITWTERNQDTGSDETASATYYCVLSVGSAHTFEITKDNAATQVDISVYACPWLLTGTSHEPVTLDCSQGSTLYVMLEPLTGDITKLVAVGKKRAVSFGDATDYYSKSTGTGLLSFSYTFESVAPENTPLFVNGFLASDPDLSPYGGCGCIGFIGVDLR